MNKKQIIDEYSKNEFMDFLESDKTGEVLKLFDEEGIDILNNSRIKEERITYILSFSPYKNKLLQNIGFLDILLYSDTRSYYATLKELDSNTYQTILNRAIELSLSFNEISRLFNFFEDEFKLEIIENKILNKEIIIEILNKSYNPKIVQKILDTYNIDLIKDNVKVPQLFEKGKKALVENLSNKEKQYISINPHLITNELAVDLWNKYDIFELRKIVDNAYYSTDASVLNNYIKKQEEQIISSHSKMKLLSPYDEIYITFEKYQALENIPKNDKLNYNRQLYVDLRYKFERLCQNTNIKNLSSEIKNIYIKNDINEVYNYIKKLSDRNISNYIIDYHFEENYHNIILDMNELLQYYYDGNIVIPQERIYLYEQIRNIDYLTIEEQQQLHETLKNYKMIELFYDDMRYARDMVAESIKEYSLSKESLEKYIDETLTEKYGVPVYNMNGKPFFGIVKTGRRLYDQKPTGHSFSLVGTNGIVVYGDTSKGNTFLYDSEDMKKEQLVHAFPYDSFTMYRPYEFRDDASRRVYTLMSPEKLTSYSPTYTEILLLEQGKEKTQIDEYIPQLKQIAVYCIDNITEEVINSAKNSGIGIILIDSSKYQSDNKYRHAINGYDEMKYNYFDGRFDKEYHEEMRL